MKITQTYLVSYEYRPERGGGLARHAKHIIDGLIKLNPKKYIGIVATRNKHKAKETNIEYIYIKYFDSGLLGYIEFAWKVYLNHIKNNKKRLFVFFSLFSFLIPFLLPREYSIFVHNTVKRVFITDYPDEGLFDKMIKKVQYFFLYTYEKFICKRSNRVFVVSQSTKDDVTQQYHVTSGSVDIISNGINLAEFKKGVAKKNSKKLLFVGRLVPRKNILNLIEIMNILVKQNNTYQLNIIGGGNKGYTETIRNKITEHGLEKHIHIHTDVDDNLLKTHYKQSSIFIFPSLVEGFGLVLLEAMINGLPVIAYMIGGVKDVIQNGKQGYLAPVGDINAIVDNIIKLESPVLFNEFSIAAIHRVDDFNLQSSIEKLNDIL